MYTLRFPLIMLVSMSYSLQMSIYLTEFPSTITTHNDHSDQSTTVTSGTPPTSTREHTKGTQPTTDIGMYTGITTAILATDANTEKFTGSNMDHGSQKDDKNV